VADVLILARQRAPVRCRLEPGRSRVLRGARSVLWPSAFLAQYRPSLVAFQRVRRRLQTNLPEELFPHLGDALHHGSGTRALRTCAIIGRRLLIPYERLRVAREMGSKSTNRTTRRGGEEPGHSSRYSLVLYPDRRRHRSPDSGNQTAQAAPPPIQASRSISRAASARMITCRSGSSPFAACNPGASGGRGRSVRHCQIAAGANRHRGPETDRRTRRDRRRDPRQERRRAPRGATAEDQTARRGVGSPHRLLGVCRRCCRPTLQVTRSLRMIRPTRRRSRHAVRTISATARDLRNGPRHICADC
jgi:hypothetical protein